MEETNALVWCTGFVAAAVMAVTAGLTVYNLHNSDVTQRKMTACVQAGNIWVQNSNREMECRKG